MNEQTALAATDNRPTLFDPAARAVAALALAVVAFGGQNLLQAALQALLLGHSGGDPRAYFTASAMGAAIPFLVAVALAWGPARRRDVGWAGSLARAAVLISVLGIAGAVLLAATGMFSRGFLPEMMIR